MFPGPGGMPPLNPGMMQMGMAPGMGGMGGQNMAGMPNIMGPTGMAPGMGGPPGMQGGPTMMGQAGMMAGMPGMGMLPGPPGTMGGPRPPGMPGGMGHGGSQSQGRQGDAGPHDRERTGGVFFKTRICHDWREGKCQFGERCRYAHGEHELQRQRDRDLGQGADERPGPGPGPGPGRQRDEAWRKTRMCKDWQQGHCSFGERCFYAHGDAELRPPPNREHAAAHDTQHQHQHQQGGMGQGGMGMGGMGQGGMGMGGMGQGGMGQGGMATGVGIGMAGQQGGGAWGGQEQQVRGAPGGGRGGGRQGGRRAPNREQSGSALLRPPKQPAPGPLGVSTSAAAGREASPAPSPAAKKGMAALEDPAARAEARYIERVRATCGVLNIGHAAALSKERQELVTAALHAVRTRAAYKANPFADDVSSYLPAPVARAKAVAAAGGEGAAATSSPAHLQAAGQ